MPLPQGISTERLNRAMRSWRVLNALEKQFDSAKQKLDIAVQGMTHSEIAEYTRMTGLGADPIHNRPRRRVNT